MGDCCSSERGGMMGTMLGFLGPPKYSQNVFVWHARGDLKDNVVFYPDMKDKANDQSLMRHEL